MRFSRRNGPSAAQRCSSVLYSVIHSGDRARRGRANRPNDFRASGGVRLDYEPHESVDIAAVLDAAELWSDAIRSPFCSPDVAYDPDNNIDPQLIEFQCVNFGRATAEKSSGYYVSGSEGRTRVEETCNLESVFAMTTSAHIESRTPNATWG